jgi:hypothetical protein
MSRYFFHIRDGLALVPDEEGVECIDLIAALEEALSSAKDIAMADLRSGCAVGAVTIEIEDEDGNAVVNVAPRHVLH